MDAPAASPLPPPVAMDPTAAATTNTCNGTALAAVEVMAEATEEEVYDGCYGTNSQCHLNDTLLGMGDGILLRLIVVATGGAKAAAAVAAAAALAGSMATVRMLMPTIKLITGSSLD